MSARRFRSATKRGLAARALLIFALLCGLALVLARAAPGEVAKGDPHELAIQRVLGELERVSLAIEERNYGAARATVRKARAELLELVPLAERP